MNQLAARETPSLEHREWSAEELVPDLTAYPRTVAELVERRAELLPDHDMVMGFVGEELRTTTGREFYARSLAVNARLRELGVDKGDRVALLAPNKPRWGICYSGVVASGAVVVPIDPLLTEHEYGHILRESRARVLLAHDRVAGDVEEHREDFPDLEAVIDIDGWPLLDPDTPTPEVEEPPTRPAPEDTCSILFTSGTTGQSKAVRLLHRNLVTNAKQLLERVYIDSRDTFVSVLPLFHTFECTCGLLLPLYSGARVIYTPSLKSRDIIRTIRAGEGSIMLGVPLLFEKLLAGIHSSIAKQPALKRAAFRASLGLVKLGRAVLQGRWGKGIFRGLRDKAGMAKLRLMISGAAALDPNVARGFEHLGLLLIQGYGLTETSPVTNANYPDFERAVPESIGPCLWGTEVLVYQPDEHGHGELCYRGPQVMPGYLDNAAANAAVFMDADIPADTELTGKTLYAAGPGVDEVPPEQRGPWFRTGDIGWIDAAGYPRIAGRQKNVIVTAAGKNVYPEQIEEYLSRSPFVAECVIMGRRQPDSNREDVVAVIVPDYEHFDLAAREKGYQLNQTKIRETLRREVGRINDQLASFKRIKDFVIREEEFPKTSTKKIKRYLLRTDVVEAPGK